MEKIYIVKGMGCGHCKKMVEKAISALKGCEAVDANLTDGTVRVTGNVNAAEIAKAVAVAGFEFAGVADATCQG